LQVHPPAGTVGIKVLAQISQLVGDVQVAQEIGQLVH